MSRSPRTPHAPSGRDFGRLVHYYARPRVDDDRDEDADDDEHDDDRAPRSIDPYQAESYGPRGRRR